MLTILCSKQESSDIGIVGTGKLILYSACKAYETRVLIQTQTILITNSTEKYIIPQYIIPQYIIPQYIIPQYIIPQYIIPQYPLNVIVVHAKKSLLN